MQKEVPGRRRQAHREIVASLREVDGAPCCESDAINEARAVRVTRRHRKGALWSFAPRWGAFLPTPGSVYVPSGTYIPVPGTGTSQSREFLLTLHTTSFTRLHSGFTAASRRLHSLHKDFAKLHKKLETSQRLHRLHTGFNTAQQLLNFQEKLTRLWGVSVYVGS